ncbi:MAG: acetyl-CoA hydrolase/transferase family protein, partial [Mycobacterium sp.]
GRIRSGDLVRLPMGPVPVTLIEALAARRDELRDVTVWQGSCRHPHPWRVGDPSWTGHVQVVSDFLSPMLRAGMDARTTDFAVTDYALAERVRDCGRRDSFAADVFFGLVTEPDAEGYVTFGYSLWHTRALLQAARLKVAEIGRGMITPCGNTRIHLSEFDLLVDQEKPPVLVPPPSLSDERIEVTEVIGAYVSTLVEDGDTLQVGTGTLSSCMGSYLTEKNDLGLDAEILVASTIELVKSGVASGKYKTYRPGIATGSFIVPGADFAFCDRNPGIELHDIQWCNDVTRIAGIRNLIAINQGSMIDLTGQVASESIGPAMFTGPGGQLNWMMGALYAPGGRSVLVLPSTARQGSVSRIVPELAPGTLVTVPRPYVDTVITEHGMANLQGLTQRQRSEALIELAHPDFRSELAAVARGRFWP